MKGSHYTLTISRKNKTLYYRDGDMNEDKFSKLATGDALARVSMMYTRSMSFGTEKVSATVSLACDQNESTINRAGELAFLKAMELTDDGFGVLLQQLENEKNQQGG